MHLFLLILKWYATVGGVFAFFTTAWVCFMSLKAELIIDKGKWVKVKNGPIFTQHSQPRMGDWFVMTRGFGFTVATFLLWPLFVFLHIKYREWRTDFFQMVEAIEPESQITTKQ